MLLIICYENVVNVVFFFFFNKIFDGFVLLMSVIASVYNNLQILVSKFFVLSVLSANRITQMLTPWILSKVPFSCHFSFSYIMGLKISLSISMIYRTINKGVQNTLSLRTMLSMNQWGEMEEFFFFFWCEMEEFWIDWITFIASPSHITNLYPCSTAFLPTR